MPPGYLSHIHTFRFLQGSLQPGGVVFDQQLAATLQAQTGDTITLTPRRGAPPRLRVTGVALVTAPDQLFQPLNPLLGPAPAQPPANIAILPLATFAGTVAPRYPSIARRVGATAVPGSQTGTQWQVQAQVDPGRAGRQPGARAAAGDATRNRVERSLPGQVLFVDNLSDSLNSAAGDALYAETLYIMLAVPGALVALGLAYLAALGNASNATAATWRCSAPAAPAVGTSSRSPASRASRSASSPACSAPALGARRAFSPGQRGAADSARGRHRCVAAICVGLAALGGGAAGAHRRGALRASVGEGGAASRRRAAALAAALPRLRSRSR